MNHNYIETLKILVNSHRLPGETNEDLVNRVINDPVIFSAICNSDPTISNASIVRGLLTNKEFINFL